MMTIMLQNDPDLKALWADIGAALSRRTGLRSEAHPVRAVTGGDINRAMRIRHGASDYFVKLNRAKLIDMFEAESAGLEDIAATGALRCPLPITSGVSGNTAYLVLEFLDMGGHANAHALGEGLAAMHQSTHKRYGWHRDNTIGATPQRNGWSDNWVRFLKNERLGYQLERARDHGYGAVLYDSGQRLLQGLGALFTQYNPPASLLHGDLWGGNYGYLANGEPVIFDPAPYYGDRESDLAMTELFGGFPAEFYDAYHHALPLDAGYPTRCKLYQLYHVLNHLNLFGSGYRARAQHLVNNLLAEMG